MDFGVPVTNSFVDIPFKMWPPHMFSSFYHFDLLFHTSKVSSSVYSGRGILRTYTTSRVVRRKSNRSI